MDKLIEYIKTASNGSFISPILIASENFSEQCPVLLDKNGRNIFGDPNVYLSIFFFEQQTYYVKKYQWNAIIYESGYVPDIFEQETAHVISKIDLTPDYVTDFYKNNPQIGPTIWPVGYIVNNASMNSDKIKNSHYALLNAGNFPDEQYLTFHIENS